MLYVYAVLISTIRMKPNTYSQESKQPTNTAICILFVARRLSDLGTQVLRSLPKSLVSTNDLGLGLSARLTAKAYCNWFQKFKETVKTQ